MHTTSPSDNVQRHHEQFPVDIKVLRGVRFETDLGDLMRIVVMSDNATPRHASYREYHYGNVAVPVDSVSSIVMRSRLIDGSEQAIDEFALGMSPPLDIPQVVSFCRGTQELCGAKNRLFKAIDPDDSTKMMGLLVEQEEHGNLLRVTWYKTWEASAAFRVIPEMLEFQLVKDENHTPSLDPNHIGGWTWYFSTNIGMGLSAPSIKA